MNFCVDQPQPPLGSFEGYATIVVAFVRLADLD